MSNSLIEIRNISKAYLNKKILSDITYSFENGYIYAILGASGSGKTTLLNILGLLDNKYEGDVIINDTIISKSKDNYEKRAFLGGRRKFRTSLCRIYFLM